MTRVRLENIKSYEDVEFDLRVESGEPRQCTAVVGENAAGKTTLLQAIALCCLGPTLSTQLTSARVLNLLRNGADRGAIELELELSVDPGATAARARPDPRRTRSGPQAHEFLRAATLPDAFPLVKVNHIDRIDSLRNQAEMSWGFCCGYGAFRGLRRSDGTGGSRRPSSGARPCAIAV